MTIEEQIEQFRNEINIADIYNQYLENLNKERQEDEYHKDSRWRNISSAGMCFRKHWFKEQGVVPEPMMPDSLRLLRLGTLVHSDIQDALEWYEKFKCDRPIFMIEQEVELPEYNCRGFLDVFSLQGRDLTDLKTTAAYKWKMMFGRNPDKNPSVNYQLQLGTYGIWLRKEGYDLRGMELLYYNKDNSQLKPVEVELAYLDKAAAYWEAVNEVLEDGKPPLSAGVAPVMAWECNVKYCPYYNTCKGETALELSHGEHDNWGDRK